MRILTSCRGLRLTAAGYSALAILAATAAPAAAQSSWAELEARHAVVSRIDIVIADVFDAPATGERHWLARAANAAHVETRRAVVARELLFAAGEPVNASRIDESARNLRRYRFVRDARIQPADVNDGGGVTARVEVFDAWSLEADLTFDRAGGSATWEARLDEANLFGRGKQLAIGRGQDIARTSTDILYTDPRMMGSRWALTLGGAGLSDGHSRMARVARPYYALETRGAAGVDVRDAALVTTQYSDGRAVYTIKTRRSTAALFASRAVRIRARTAWRAGVMYREDRAEYDAPVAASRSSLTPPQALSRELRGFAATASMVQDRPATFANLAAIDNTEDYNLGWVVAAEAGYFAASLGSDRPGAFGQSSLRKGWRPFGRGLLLVDAVVGGRRDHRRWQDATAGVQITGYGRGGRWQTIAAQLNLSAVAAPEPGHWLYLGGDEVVRGYVHHYRVGDRRAALTIEHRVLTPWRLLDLLRVGFVAYADAGVIRRLDTGRWSRVYADVGAGLRFGNLRVSGRNVVQLSVAAPLVREAGVGRLQIVLGNTVRF